MPGVKADTLWLNFIQVVWSNCVWPWKSS